MQFLIGLIARSPWGLQAMIYLTGGLFLICAALGATVAIESARLDAAKSRQEVLGSKLEDQNRAIATWKDEAKKQEQRVEAATVQGEQVRTETVERVRTITVAVIPKECQQAIKWGAQQALVINKHWEDKE